MGMSPFDAVLLLSFGGPEQSKDVMPFLRKVTAGRGIPDERLAAVAQQYEAMGGRSPINDHNKELRDALEAELNQGVSRENPAYLPVYWGNRNWYPLVDEALAQMRDDGIQQAAVVVTSGYSSYSGCRQYREDLYDAAVLIDAEGEGSGPELHKIRRWFDQPAFIDAMTDNVVAAIESLDLANADGLQIAFTTHSIPLSQAERAGDPAMGGNMYVRQHEFVAAAISAQVAERVGNEVPWELVFQSRSGPPRMPWLEPDISDHLEAIAAAGSTAVVVVPIGFMSDHMEVLWDLDTVARDSARECGLAFARASTVGNDPRFVTALAGLVRERELGVPDSERVALAPWGPAPDVCPVGCCANPKQERPALCGAAAAQEHA